MNHRIVVIGAGAAGLMAAAEAARRGASVRVLEKSPKTGVKILMSGGTRCNLTHHTDASGITQQFGHARRFLQPSVGAFAPADLIAMFNRAGLPTKVESTGKVFPQSDRAIHVRDLLHRQAVSAGATICCATAVIGIANTDSGWLVQTKTEAIAADRVIVTVGGQSYPGCGTTGDGYDWLSRLGHSIVTPRPALVPLVGGHAWTRELSGLALDDVQLTVRVPAVKKPIASRRGPLLMTHFGISGPAAMDVSGAITAAGLFDQICLTADVLPEIAWSEIERRLGDRIATVAVGESPKF